MAEKTKTINHVKHVPKDAQVIMSIIKDMGITDYEPKIINQLLEFTYRYITGLLDDSKVFANHAKKKLIDFEDVKLAVTMQLEKTSTNPPPRDVLLDVARVKNNISLPAIMPNNGLRLPPDRYCLNSVNYQIKTPMRKLSYEQMKSELSIVKRPSAFSTLARTQTVGVPKPVFKFSPGGVNSQSASIIDMEIDKSSKRKREDDDYDAP